MNIIERVVCNHYNVSIDDIKGKSRKAHIVEPRHVIFFLTYKETPATFKAIAKLYGVHQSSVMHAVDKMENNQKPIDDIRPLIIKAFWQSIKLEPYSVESKNFMADRYISL